MITWNSNQTCTRFGAGSRGFTLVELLVVISIIGILVGMTLPAVQAVREAARRVKCSNHLHQMALAFQLHHDSHSFFPSGGWNWNSAPTQAIGRDQQAGWGFQILPYIEAQNVFDSDPVVAIGATNSIFFCPSRRGPQIVQLDDHYDPPLGVSPIDHALCDYAASNREGNGAVRRFEPVQFSDIYDGTSNTLLVGEKRLNVFNLGQPQDDDNEGYTTGFNEDTIRSTLEAPAQDYAAPTGDGEKLFGSSHPSLLNIALVDGSVRSISLSIDAETFRRLGDRDDGETLTLK